MMRVLLINPPTGTLIRDDRCQVPVANLSSGLRMPLDLACLASVFQAHGWESRVGDYQAYSDGADKFWREFHNFAPDLLIVNCTTPTLRADLAFCAQVKKARPGVKIIVKGAHFAVEAKEVLADALFIDAAIKQEAEFAAADLAAGWANEKILGLVYRAGEEIKENPNRPFEKNLDLAPLPARDLLDNDLYVRPDTGDRMTSVLVGRGCANNCAFCLVKAVAGSVDCRRSVDSVVNEIRECLDKYKIKNFYLRADNFTAERAWVAAFCEAIIRRGLPVEWFANSRVDTLDSGLSKLMKRAGCVMLGLGIESGNQEILDRANKKITLDQSRAAVVACRSAGILTYLFFVLGLPGESRETLEQTRRFALELDGDFVEFHEAYPFPGTEIFVSAQAGGLVADELFGRTVFNAPALAVVSKTELDVFRRRVTRQFYLRPRQIFRAVKRVRSWAMLKNYLRKAWRVMK